MRVKFNTFSIGADEWESVGIPFSLIQLLEDKEVEVDDEVYPVINLDDDEAEYYDITYVGDAFSVTLEAVSNYHLTEIE